MKAVALLPEGYSEYYSLDLQKNKKIAFWVNFAAVLIGVLMCVPVAVFFVPITNLLDFNLLFNEEVTLTVSASSEILLKMGVLLVGMIGYMVLHELVHGVAMKICGTNKVKYGFTGLYAFAGSDDFYNKSAYIFIALAPVVLWGVVLGVVNFFVPVGWFWVVYIIQIVNISGAAGDFFVTLKFSRFPKDILVKDAGVSVTVYSASEK